MNKSVNVRFSDLLPLIQDAIESGKTFSFTAFGNSMHPFIQGGRDRVTLVPPTLPPKVGDVVFYRRKNGDFVLHRIIRIESGILTICGDNQFISEENIKTDQIIARFYSRERRGKILHDNSVFHYIWKGHLPIRRLCLHIADFVKRSIKNLFKTDKL